MKRQKYPQFSATIGCYEKDNPKDFEVAFLSIYNQTVRPNEIIITVDGPIPPELDAVVTRFEREFQAVILRSEQNNGLGMAHAQAVSHAKYDWIAIMDADDISVSDRFEKQLSYIIEHPDVTVLGGQIEEFIGSSDNIVGKRCVPVDDVAIKKYIKKRCPFNHMSIIAKKNDILKVGNYQDWHYNEDYFLYCRLFLENVVFHNLPDTLVYVRVGEEMYKRRGGMKYFRSEAKLQRWMLTHNIISHSTFLINIFIRLCVQVLMPNSLRGFIFQKIFRK